MLLLALTGCGTVSSPPPEPVVSPTGIIYAVGTPPTPTRFSQTAELYLSQERFERALDLALEGAESDPANPIHYFLAGTAYARTRRYEEAHRMFAEAERIFPAYELDTEPEREAAWAEAYNAGLEAYAAGNAAGGIEAWELATTIFDLRPEGHRNLAGALAMEARYDDAITAYRRGIAGLRRSPATRSLTADEVRAREAARTDIEESLIPLLLFTARFSEAEPLLRRQLRRDPTDVQVRADLAAALSGQGKIEEAREIYTTLLSAAQLGATELFNIGVSLFRSGDAEGASEAFGRLTELQPNSRDAWFNYANALFAAEAWESLAGAGDRLVELDPLNENAGLIAARAHLEMGDEPAARGALARIEASQVYVEGLQMSFSGSRTSVLGRVVGNAAESGAPVRLRFTFYGDSGALGTETLTVRAPSSGERAAFDVTFATRAASYSYELVP